MSEFLAEARIRVVPDTTRFRAQLQEEVTRAVSQTRVPPINVPIAIGASGVGLAGVSAATAALAASQETATSTTLGLASAAQVENTAFGRQAVILGTVTTATELKAGADLTASRAARVHAQNVGQVEKAALASTAGMLGLRGAVLTAGSAFIAATVGFQAFGKAISSAIDLERQLNVFRATAGATADEMERVSQAARDLGRDITLPGVSASDAAVALTELAKAGLTVEQALAGARGTLQLATAAQVDNATAANLVASALNAFTLGGDQAAKVADDLAGAANASQGSVEDMGIALRQSASAASQLGFSLDDTITLLTALARAGLAGSDAGTTLRVALLRLVAPTKDAQAALDKFNITLRDSLSGDVRVEALFELEKALRRVSKAEADQARVAIFGQNAFRVSALLGRLTVEQFRDLEKSVTAAGNAQELAAAQTQGLGGDVEAAKNQFADLGITVGKVASGPLGLFVRTAGATAGAVNEMNAAVAESAGGQGFFATFGDLLDGINDSFADLNISFQQGVRAAQDQRAAFSVLDSAAESAAGAVNDLADALQRAAENTLSGQGLPEEGLNTKQILNRIQGFDAEEVRARISGDNNSILAVLQQEQDFLEQQLQRQFVRNRPALRRRLEQALLGVVNDIASIQRQGAAETKRAVDDAERAQREADQALLDLLSNRRADAERKAAAAGQTTGLQDDIRAQDRIQALIKIQIAKIRAQVKDEQTRKSAIRELRIALIASRQEEDALRKARAEQAAARKDEIQNLNIQIAEERGNKSAIERAIQTRIDTLNKQIKAAKGDQVKVKQLILERERLKNQLEELNKTQQDATDQGKTFAQQAFEFAQSLQGFSANLLGNLIPGFATGGLVGGSQPTAREVPSDVGAGVRQAGVLQAAETRGVRPVQVDTTNAILRQILAAIQGRPTSPPEIAENRRTGSAVFDTL